MAERVIALHLVGQQGSFFQDRGGFFRIVPEILGPQHGLNFLQPSFLAGYVKDTPLAVQFFEPAL